MTSTCDNECIRGTIHQGPPQGTMQSICGLNTYVVGNNDNPRGIIVMYSDVFGLELVNNKLIADAYAKNGEWLVYLPDFFLGDPVPLRIADIFLPVDRKNQSTIGKYTGILANVPAFLGWKSRHSDESDSKIFFDFMKRLREETPQNRKIGIVGFCYGGRYAIRAALEKNMVEIDGMKVPLVDAVVAHHPSRVAIPDEVRNLVVPVAFGWGLEDTTVKIEDKTRVEQVHVEEKKQGRAVPEMEHKVYKPGRHGFAVRGNPDDPGERACLEDSVKQVLHWFARWL